MNPTTINFIIEGTKTNKDNKVPIKLNIYNKDIGQKRYGIKMHISKEDWQKLYAPKLKDRELINLKSQLKVIELKAQKAINALENFSFIAFEELFFETNKQTSNSLLLADWFKKYISQLKENAQIGTASSYTSTFNSLNSFKKNLTFYDITPNFLQAYENQMIAKGKSGSTIGIYLRQLRAIFNQAISENTIQSNTYPFKKYQIPASKNIKKALSFEDLQKLLSYKTDDTKKQKAIDFWMLSYLCNGINFSDIAHLKKENIDGNYLYYFRQKTKRTKKKNLTPIKVALNPKAIEIIKMYKNDIHNDYLFPILQPELSPITIKNRIKKFIKLTNQQMQEIGNELNIDQNLNTYAARHSYSTVMKRKGAPTSYIKEALGHSSEVTTESYLDSFTDDVKLNYANLLTEL